MSTSKLTLAQRRKLLKIDENIRQQLNEAIDKELFAKFKALFKNVKQTVDVLKANDQITIANQLATTLDNIKGKFAKYKQVNKKSTIDKIKGFLGRISKDIFDDEDGDFKLLEKEFMKCMHFYELVAQKVDAAEINESFHTKFRRLMEAVDEQERGVQSDEELANAKFGKKPVPATPKPKPQPQITAQRPTKQATSLDAGKVPGGSELPRGDQHGSNTLQSIVMSAGKQAGMNVDANIAREIAQIVKSGKLAAMIEKMQAVGKEIQNFDTQVSQRSNEESTEQQPNQQTNSSSRTQSQTQGGVNKDQVIDWIKQNVKDKATQDEIFNALSNVKVESYNDVLRHLLSN
jgi:hypothetical protein